jgi:hypothetical protein
MRTSTWGKGVVSVYSPIVSHHIISYHNTSYHIISYLIISSLSCHVLLPQPSHWSPPTNPADISLSSAEKAEKPDAKPDNARKAPGGFGMKRLIQMVNDFVTELDVPRPPHVIMQPLESNVSFQPLEKTAAHTSHGGNGNGKTNRHIGNSMTHTNAGVLTSKMAHPTMRGEGNATTNLNLSLNATANVGATVDVGTMPQPAVSAVSAVSEEGSDGRLSPTADSVASSLTHVGV